MANRRKAAKQALKPGNPFPCPWCGTVGQGFDSNYWTSESQGVVLVIGENGGVEEQDYTGGSNSYISSETEYYHCRACGRAINLGGRKRADDALSPHDVGPTIVALLRKRARLLGQRQSACARSAHARTIAAELTALLARVDKEA